MREDGQIGSVRKAMEILKQISDAEDGVINLRDLAQQLNLPKSTCVHILNTLCDGGFVQHTATYGEYALGPMSYYISRNGKYQKRLVRLCHPLMNWLNRQTQQTVLLSVLHGRDKYIVHYVNGERELRTKGNIILGHLFSTATGRAMVANLSPEERKQLFLRCGMPQAEQWPEAATPEGLQQEIEKIRAQGYVKVIAEEGDLLDIGLGCAIHDEEGVVGAIGMALRYIPKNTNMCDDEMDIYIGNLRRAVREINHRLTFENVRAPLQKRDDIFMPSHE